jgi:hypothetical protein
MHQEKLNIICLSNQLWDFENWTNKRHVMSRLGKEGHRVLFVDPPINVGRVFFHQIRRGNWSLRRLVTQEKIDGDSRVWVYTPLNILPFSWITSLFHVLWLRLLTRRLDPKRKTVLWVYNMEIPHLKRYVRGLKHNLLVYDCVDNYAGFPRYNTPKKKLKIQKIENYLAKAADLVFASAPGLYRKHKIANRNTHFTPNVGDYDKFKDTKKHKFKIPADLKEIPEPRVGFIGAVDEYKFDFSLLKKIAKDHPKISFVIIGPVGLKDREASAESLGISKHENIHYLGSRPYNQKIKYMAGFDADIIPYVQNSYTIGGCFPVKFHDSLAAGLPVVVTNLPCYEPFKDVCYISKTPEEFSKNIKKAIKENSLQKIKDRQKVAKENSWENKVKTMLGLVNKELFK